MDPNLLGSKRHIPRTENIGVQHYSHVLELWVDARSGYVVDDTRPKSGHSPLHTIKIHHIALKNSQLINHVPEPQLVRTRADYYAHIVPFVA